MSIGSALTTMTVPSTILLPTDFTARCDRSLTRALQLARAWGASLVLLHVLNDSHNSSASKSEDIARAQARLQGEVRDESVAVQTHIATGDVAEAILGASRTFGADLIVTGISRRDEFADFIVGSTVERLARISRLPILVVKERAAKPYDNIMVATDFSGCSADALRAAITMFPDARFSLVHAYHVQLEILRDREEQAGVKQAVIATELEAFLASLDIRDDLRANLDVNVDYGHVCQVGRDHAQTSEADLAVVGTRGRSGLVSTLLGSKARALVECLPCDVLMVPQTLRPVSQSG